MVLIKNTQKSVPISPALLHRFVVRALEELGYGDFDVGIWLTSNRTIRAFNAQYRKKNKTTDILSFPFHHDAQPDRKIVARTPEDRNLGDIMISAEYARKKAIVFGVPFDDHLKRLLVHGLCHLVGYDHETDAQYEVMHKREQALLKSV